MSNMNSPLFPFELAGAFIWGIIRFLFICFIIMASCCALLGV